MCPVAGLLAIAVFHALVFLVGLYAGRRSRGDDGSSGRRMPILLDVVTMTATWVGGGYINGTPEAVYDSARSVR
ncbi:MAG: hypothetical protein JXQ73_28995 [Phycisphaerae bacterium]|nr:hypothetical protein [Phycisphaerae bacterium]